MPDAMNHAAPMAPTAAAVAQQAGEMIVRIARDLGFWAYLGTRAQLEAEGVIPASTVWPEGASRLYWDDGLFRWSLYRVRPEGMRGPKRLWTTGDWWQLRRDLPGTVGEGRIADMKRALDREVFRLTPAGKRAFHALLARLEMARRDKAYQHFKALIPGLIPPPRGHKPKARGAGAQP